MRLTVVLWPFFILLMLFIRCGWESGEATVGYRHCKNSFGPLEVAYDSPEESIVYSLHTCRFDMAESKSYFALAGAHVRTLRVQFAETIPDEISWDHPPSPSLTIFADMNVFENEGAAENHSELDAEKIEEYLDLDSQGGYKVYFHFEEGHRSIVGGDGTMSWPDFKTGDGESEALLAFDLDFEFTLGEQSASLEGSVALSYQDEIQEEPSE